MDFDHITPHYGLESGMRRAMEEEEEVRKRDQNLQEAIARAELLGCGVRAITETRWETGLGKVTIHTRTKYAPDWSVPVGVVEEEV